VVNFDGAKKRIQLIDGNVNGTFNDMASNPYTSDRVQVEGRQNRRTFFGQDAGSGRKTLPGSEAASATARSSRCKKAENVTLGQVRVPRKHFRIRRVRPRRPFRAPAG